MIETHPFGLRYDLPIRQDPAHGPLSPKYASCAQRVQANAVPVAERARTRCAAALVGSYEGPAE
jgi:hypothetical protein